MDPKDDRDPSPDDIARDFDVRRGGLAPSPVRPESADMVFGGAVDRPEPTGDDDHGGH